MNPSRTAIARIILLWYNSTEPAFAMNLSVCAPQSNITSFDFDRFDSIKLIVGPVTQGELKSLMFHLFIGFWIIPKKTTNFRTFSVTWISNIFTQLLSNRTQTFIASTVPVFLQNICLRINPMLIWFSRTHENHKHSV